MLTPRWLSRLTNVVRSSRGPSPIPASVQMREHFPDVARVQRGAPGWLVNTSPVSTSRPRPRAAHRLLSDQTQRLDRHYGRAEGAAGPLGLGLAVRGPIAIPRAGRAGGLRVAVRSTAPSAGRASSVRIPDSRLSTI